ncbi:MAG: protein-methionine-sulfoxide reductase catalytic subunit MsrP [Acidobacteriota bacterium]
MLIRKPDDIPSSEITDEKLYLNRRNFIRGGVLVGTAAATTLLYRRLAVPAGSSAPPSSEVTTRLTSELGETATSYEDITTYNNFYEFSTSKDGVASRSSNFVTRPWTIEVTGMVNRPRTFDLDELLRRGVEERVYRFRCVEAWSMVIPWLGVPLGRLLDEVEPLGSASFVAFQTLLDPARMPNQRTAVLDWPYVEGLRLDEARHPLTLLSTGLYGRQLLPQNGAPVRLVVPWKYGFKSIKSIVRIELTDRQPRTTWSDYAPDEYGFYSNVNPEVAHPRWSQSRERRIGEWGMRDTRPFNGYADQVASLYQGMDLRRYY